MKFSRILPLLCIAGLNINLTTEAAYAADEDAFMGQISSPSEQAMGYGRSAIWTLPLVATQYQPSQPIPAMQAALQAQQEARFLDALILLDEARKSGKVDADTRGRAEFAARQFFAARQSVPAGVGHPLSFGYQCSTCGRCICAYSHGSPATGANAGSAGRSATCARFGGRCFAASGAVLCFAGSGAFGGSARSDA